MKTLLCWVGFTDIRAAKKEPQVGLGPIGQVVEGGEFDDALLMMDANTAKDRKVLKAFLAEVSGGKTTFEFRPTKLENPIDFRSIYTIANEALSELLERDPRREITIHLSPGTPSMAAVWILLAAKSGQAVQLIQSSQQRGVEAANLPFDIHAEYVPDLVRAQGKRLAAAAAEPHIQVPGFEDIKFKSPTMGRVIERADKVAVHDVPVLIQGESGTGKEMFAKAICKASRRPDEPVVVNCGAFPETLLESLLFGYVKGAFTGANKDTAGFFEQADGGTLFLDEIGELPLAAQSRLLRVLQEGKLRRLGSGEEKPVDVRIISATNRDLKEEVRAGKFREDLYYRLAVTSLTLPPLRERRGDLQLLVDELFEAALKTLGADQKVLSPAARKVLSAHHWPGNVRELQATLTRAIIWSQGNRITGDDMSEAVEYLPPPHGDDLLARPLGDGFSLEDLLDEIKQEYVRRALDEAKDNKSRASELLGYKQQTLWAYLKKQGPN